MKICIFGAGAIGGFLGVKLCAAGADVTFVARGPHLAAMRANGVKLIVETERSVGGALGRPSGARFRTVERLKAYIASIANTLFKATPELLKTYEDIYKYPLLQSATDVLNRQLKAGISDPALAELVESLRQDGRLCRVTDDVKMHQPQVICSMGLRKPL